MRFTEMHDSVIAYLSPNILKQPIMHKNVLFQNIYSVQLAIMGVIWDRDSEAYLEHFQTSKVGRFVEKDNA